MMQFSEENQSNIPPDILMYYVHEGYRAELCASLFQLPVQ
jgi:hypothetical protein